MNRAFINFYFTLVIELVFKMNLSARFIKIQLFTIFTINHSFEMGQLQKGLWISDRVYVGDFIEFGNYTISFSKSLLIHSSVGVAALYGVYFLSWQHIEILISILFTTLIAFIKTIEISTLFVYGMQCLSDIKVKRRMLMSQNYYERILFGHGEIPKGINWLISIFLASLVLAAVIAGDKNEVWSHVWIETTKFLQQSCYPITSWKSTWKSNATI